MPVKTATVVLLARFADFLRRDDVLEMKLLWRVTRGKPAAEREARVVEKEGEDEEVDASAAVVVVVAAKYDDDNDDRRRIGGIAVVFRLAMLVLVAYEQQRAIVDDDVAMVLAREAEATRMCLREREEKQKIDSKQKRKKK